VNDPLRVWVERDGRWQHIPSDLLVPGDLVRLEAGDRVPTDLLLLEGSATVDESVLTGESLPVEKSLSDELYVGIAPGTHRLIRRGFAKLP
jgi:Ca2+-transporting ATPase